MSKFHYYYTFPTSITFTTFLAFVLKGQFFIPLITFFMLAIPCFFIPNLIGNALYFFSKKWADNGAERYIIHFLEKYEYAKKDQNNKWEKGRYFKGFKKTVKSVYHSKVNLRDMIWAQNAMLFTILITTIACIPDFIHSSRFTTWFLIIVSAYFIMYQLTYCTMYGIINKQPFVEDIIDEIEKQQPAAILSTTTP